MMAVAVREQQKIILSNHGYDEAVLKKKESIIPLSIKEKLQEIKKFDEAFQIRPRFSGRGLRRRKLPRKQILLERELEIQRYKFFF